MDFVLFDWTESFTKQSSFLFIYLLLLYFIYSVLLDNSHNLFCIHIKTTTYIHTNMQYLDLTAHYDSPIPTFFLTFNHLCIYGVVLMSDQSVICHSFRLVLTFG